MASNRSVSAIRTQDKIYIQPISEIPRFKPPSFSDPLEALKTQILINLNNKVQLIPNTGPYGEESSLITALQTGANCFHQYPQEIASEIIKVLAILMKHNPSLIGGANCSWGLKKVLENLGINCKLAQSIRPLAK